ncbi:uncharacterized protein LOC115332713 [Ixodes scapularis]|uniref:uncharacterized protein LOC115332713 n=1 Tax=Ixodes scapularis TaxID=6945 RepID=UPI001C383208|nr:uncharacterized protein LOC115332713 [Ixodes scapularis]
MASPPGRDAARSRAPSCAEPGEGPTGESLPKTCPGDASLAEEAHPVISRVLFVESSRQFRAVERTALADVREDSRETTSAHVAAAAQASFARTALFCRGVLAGVALWHAVAGATPFSGVFHGTFYLLITVCTVASCDLIDGSTGVRKTLVACVYPLTLLVHLTIHGLDRRLGPDEELPRDKRRTSLQLLRCAGALMAWALHASCEDRA